MLLQSSLHPAFLFVLITLISSIAHGAPLHDEEDSHFSKRESYLAITGLQSSGTHQRLEIRQLQHDTPQWNLYLLALNRFHDMSPADKSSYYQVAGIHGRPFIPWDGADFAPGQEGGYCTHEIILFPTWHRPYLALYEQIIYGIVQQIANEQKKDKMTYVAAAKTFRIPYWDWAAPAQEHAVYPSVFQGIWDGTTSWLDISMPTGTQRIRNPLYSYTFHPSTTSDFPDGSVCLQAHRPPSSMLIRAVSYLADHFEIPHIS